MENTALCRRIWRSATMEGVPRRSLYVAVVVGTVLNVINQGDALVGSGNVNWFKIALTYCVPYLVCTYGAVAAKIHHDRADQD